jgi:3-phenylpropionate/cinnamic acid dioxygenase small subunit
MSATIEQQYQRFLQVNTLLAEEADHIDRRRWQDWVNLYTEDATFWVPAWRNEDETTQDPKREISLIYLPQRGIEDRVFRFSSGDSYASTPLPTTSHVVGSVRIIEDAGDTLEVQAKGAVVTMDPRTGVTTRGVWYEYQLRDEGGQLRIASKKVTLLEAVIDGTVDVYNV